MTKLTPADYLLGAGLALTGAGLYFIYPAAAPYFALLVGLLMCTLGGLGIVKWRRR